MPAASHTARTAAPAITPVPGAAGTSTTSGAPKCPITGGNRAAFQRHFDHAARAVLDGLLHAGRHFVRLAIAPADPAPAVADDDHAAKLNRRPPLTTAAQRWILMTFRSVRRTGRFGRHWDYCLKCLVSTSLVIGIPTTSIFCSRCYGARTSCRSDTATQNPARPRGPHRPMPPRGRDICTAAVEAHLLDARPPWPARQWPLPTASAAFLLPPYFTSPLSVVSVVAAAASVRPASRRSPGRTCACGCETRSAAAARSCRESACAPAGSGAAALIADWFFVIHSSNSPGAADRRLYTAYSLPHTAYYFVIALPALRRTLRRRSGCPCPCRAPACAPHALRRRTGRPLLVDALDHDVRLVGAGDLQARRNRHVHFVGEADAQLQLFFWTAAR